MVEHKFHNFKIFFSQMVIMSEKKDTNFMFIFKKKIMQKNPY